MNFQDAAALTTPDGSVKNIHNKNSDLLWSAVGYNVRYDGDSTQQTYSGKNKIFLAPLTTTASNINWVVTKDTISASGTASSNWSIPRGFAAFATPLPAGSYVFSIPSAIDKAFQLNMRDSNDTTYDYTIQAGNTYVSFTTSYEAKSFRFALKAGQGVETNVTMENKLQLEAGSTATAYEPYVGGIPAPNPDYPQDVNVVKGAQSVKITGKNRISIPSGTKTENGITWTREDGVVHGSGTFETYTYSNFVGTTTLSLPAGDYTFSIKEALPSPLMVEFSTRDNSNVRKNYQIPSGQTSVTKSFPNGLSRTGVALVGGTVGQEIDVTIKNIQVEPGSTATAYELYQGQIFPVDLGSTELCKIGSYQDYIFKSSGKNLFDKSGSVLLSKTYEGFVRWGYKLPKASSNFYFTKAIDDGALYRIVEDVDGVLTLRNVVGLSGEEITNSNNDFYILCFATQQQSTALNYYNNNNFMMSYDADAAYEPYGTDWYVKKETNKLVFNGSENWKQYSQNVYLDTGTFPEGVAVSSLRILGVSNRCDMNTNNMTYNSASHTGIEIRNLVSYWGVATATVADWKTWVSSNNILLYYALVTSTYTKITDTTLVGQLNAIHDWLRRYDYYGVVSGNLPIIINRSGII